MSSRSSRRGGAGDDSLGNSHLHILGECVQGTLEQLKIISRNVVTRKANQTVEAASLVIGDTHALRDHESMALLALDNPDYFINELYKSSLSEHAHNAIVNMAADTGGDKERHALRLWNRLAGNEDVVGGDVLVVNDVVGGGALFVPANEVLYLLLSGYYGNLSEYLDMTSIIAISEVNTLCCKLMDSETESLQYLKDNVFRMAYDQGGLPPLSFDRVCSMFDHCSGDTEMVVRILNHLISFPECGGMDINKLVDFEMKIRHNRAVVPSILHGWNTEEVNGGDGGKVDKGSTPAAFSTFLAQICSKKKTKERGSDDMDIDEDMDINEEDHDDECAVCKEGGDLFCCDGCTKVYHYDCHEPTLELEGLPETWYCMKCCEKKKATSSTSTSSPSSQSNDIPTPGTSSRSFIGSFIAGVSDEDMKALQEWLDETQKRNTSLEATPLPDSLRDVVNRGKKMHVFAATKVYTETIASLENGMYTGQIFCQFFLRMVKGAGFGFAEWYNHVPDDLLLRVKKASTNNV